MFRGLITTVRNLTSTTPDSTDAPQLTRVTLPTPSDALAAPTPVTVATPVTLSTTSAAAAAPATIQPQPADLIDIRVDGIDAAKANAMWLTKGKDRSQPATAVRLADCTTDHLKNIVANKPNLSADYLRVITAILADRGETLPVAVVVDDTDDTDDDTTDAIDSGSNPVF